MIQRDKKNILWFKEISLKDVPLVGGKNASLGEMYNKLSGKGINIPNGFALTSEAYWYFVKENRLERELKEVFAKLNRKSIKSLQKTGSKARKLILKGELPKDLKEKITKSYQKLEKEYGKNCEVAVRSSGVAEDAPSDSFAGQFETFLNVRGKEKLLEAIKKCLASSFGDRVIAYREEKKISHLKFALSIGVQKMARSDLASSGVIFTLDTESGFKNIVLINSIWGVGEMIVKGKITPDEFYIHKPTLKKGFKSIIVKNLGRKTKKYIYARNGGLKEVNVDPKEQLRFSLSEKEVLRLAKWAVIIEEHYGRPQDIEWAKDGKTKQLFIVQSRPETVHAPQVGHFYQEYNVKTNKPPLLTGIAIGSKLGSGKVRKIIDVSKISNFKKGEVLVTKMTDPDWVPIMRLASAIVTDEGGKTCHAAIVSRELGIPNIVGSSNATSVLKEKQLITVDCSQGSIGRVFSGRIPFKVKNYNLNKIPKLKTKIMVNIGAPDIAFQTSFLPNDGVGLARIEFILAEKIRVHPLALYHYEKLKAQSKNNKELKKIIGQIDKLTIEHGDKKEYFIKEMAEGVAQIAAAFYPKPVIVRLSDLKTNEYETLIGGGLFEPKEENPMLGWRGASRYYDKDFQPAFEMECRALKRAREIFGLKNIWIMVPFCRTPEEGQRVLDLLAKNGLIKGRNGLKVVVMCEIPSNVVLINEFLNIFDGVSIGSNDLAQLVLGLDRDNAQIAKIADERNEAVKKMIAEVVAACNRRKKYCGICGEAASIPDFARFLVNCEIESLSVNPDSVIPTILAVAKAEKK